INSSISYYRQLIAGGVKLDNLPLAVVSGAVHNEEAWALYLPACLRFLSDHWS
ncbi:alpha/beta hydrolase, partial [Streptococcus suis]